MAVYCYFQLMKKLATIHPIGRVGDTNDTTSAILFLASDAASYVTGTTLFVDGGYTVA